MIRKILVSLFLIYTLIWFAIAYIIKSNIVDNINNFATDNCKISYSQIKVAGFPSHIRVVLLDPKGQCIYPTYSEEVTSDKIIFVFDWSFKKAKLILGQAIKKIKNFEGKAQEDSIESPQDIIALVKFIKPAYQSLDSTDLFGIKFFQLNNPSLSIHHDNQEIFNIADLAFLMRKIKSGDSEEVICQTSLVYSSQSNLVILKKGALDFSIARKMTGDVNHKINSLHIDHFGFSGQSTDDPIDQQNDPKIEVKLVGGLQFPDNLPPTGKLSLELTNYHYIINKLKLLLPATITQKMEAIIEQSANTEQITLSGNNQLPSTTVKLDVEFSDKGISVGGMNLFDFKGLPKNNQEPQELQGDNLLEEDNNMQEEQEIDKVEEEIKQID